jgi:hypothetical protein
MSAAFAEEPAQINIPIDIAMNGNWRHDRRDTEPPNAILLSMNEGAEKSEAKRVSRDGSQAML